MMPFTHMQQQPETGPCFFLFMISVPVKLIVLPVMQFQKSKQAHTEMFAVTFFARAHRYIFVDTVHHVICLRVCTASMYVYVWCHHIHQCAGRGNIYLQHKQLIDIMVTAPVAINQPFHDACTMLRASSIDVMISVSGYTNTTTSGGFYSIILTPDSAVQIRTRQISPVVCLFAIIVPVPCLPLQFCRTKQEHHT